MSFFFSCIKNIKKGKDLRVLCLYVKIHPTTFSLTATLDPRVIFIILIIILNSHDSSLSEFGCNIGPKSLGCECGCKVVL